MSERPLSTQRERDALDRHITGNYGEDQFAGQEEHMGVIVLLSGGQDSSTCLAWAIDTFGADGIRPVSFDYGQRHRIELTCARRVCGAMGVMPPFVIPVEALGRIGGAALTDEDVAIDTDATGTGNKYAEEHDLPSTFVPGRNVIFLTLALAFGAKDGIYDLVTGVCETDRAGYPDCRSEFVQSLERTLRFALDEPFVNIHAPLLKRSKAETFALADELGVLDLILEHTHTCYRGERLQRWDWGYGCGACGACVERRDGYEAFQRLVRDRG